jgi:hypothetical protein
MEDKIKCPYCPSLLKNKASCKKHLARYHEEDALKDGHIKSISSNKKYSVEDFNEINNLVNYGESSKVVESQATSSVSDFTEARLSESSPYLQLCIPRGTNFKELLVSAKKMVEDMEIARQSSSLNIITTSMDAFPEKDDNDKLTQFVVKILCQIKSIKEKDYIDLLKAFTVKYNLLYAKIQAWCNTLDYKRQEGLGIELPYNIERGNLEALVMQMDEEELSKELKWAEFYYIYVVAMRLHKSKANRELLILKKSFDIVEEMSAY